MHDYLNLELGLAAAAQEDIPTYRVGVPTHRDLLCFLCMFYKVHYESQQASEGKKTYLEPAIASLMRLCKAMLRENNLNSVDFDIRTH